MGWVNFQWEKWVNFRWEFSAHTIEFIKNADRNMKLLSGANKLANIQDIIRDYDKLGRWCVGYLQCLKGLGCMTLQFIQGKGFEPRTPTRIDLEPIAIDTKSIILCTHQYPFYDLSLMPTCPHPSPAQASKWVLIPKLILKIPSSKPPSLNAFHLFS